MINSVKYIFFRVYIMSWKQNTMRGMRSNSVVNQPTGGGPKKSGLAPSNLGGAGVGLLHGRTYMSGPRGVQANYRNKGVVFQYKSYIGGIGHSVGGRSLGRMMDGVRIPLVDKSKATQRFSSTLDPGYDCIAPQVCQVHENDPRLPEANTGMFRTNDDCMTHCTSDAKFGCPESVAPKCGPQGGCSSCRLFRDGTFGSLEECADNKTCWK